MIKTYFCGKPDKLHIPIMGKKDANGREQAPKNIFFRKGFFTTDDPEMQEVIENHEWFNKRIFLEKDVEEAEKQKVKDKETGYIEGPATSAHSIKETGTTKKYTGSPIKKKK